MARGLLYSRNMKRNEELVSITENLDDVHGGFVNRFPFAAAVGRRLLRGPGANLDFWRGGNGLVGQRRCPGGNCGGQGE